MEINNKRFIMFFDLADFKNQQYVPLTDEKYIFDFDNNMSNSEIVIEINNQMVKQKTDSKIDNIDKIVVISHRLAILCKASHYAIVDGVSKIDYNIVTDFISIEYPIYFISITSEIVKSLFDVKFLHSNAWIDKDGNFYPCEDIGISNSADNLLKVLKITDISDYSKYTSDPTRETPYNSFEYLIHELSWICIENNRVIYENYYKIGDKQLKLIGCCYNSDVRLVLETPQIIKERKKAELDRQRKNKIFYDDWRNKFHSPSGCMRVGYQRYLNTLNNE